MKKRGRFGLSLIELLISLTLMAVLLGLVLPTVQQIREISRQTACRENLRNLTLAALNYEGIGRGFPVGSLGAWETASGQHPGWEDLEHDGFWQSYQHYSAFVHLLVMLERNEVYDRIPAIRLSAQARLPFDEVESTRLIRTRIPVFSCPSDGLWNSPPFDPLGYLIATSPGIAQWSNPFGLVEGFSTAFVTPSFSQELSLSNYVGCSGAHSGVPLIGYPRGFEGMFSSRRPVFQKDIFDGASNTVLFGESIGGIRNEERHTALSWAHGGLARGRGDANWGMPYSTTPFFTEYFFGDWKQSSRFGFGSKHDRIVNVSMADGSVRSIDRGIDTWIWYALCGRGDGN